MAKTYKVRMLRAKCYERRDFAAGEVAEVDETWARRWVQSGVAVLVKGEESLPEPGPVTTADLVQHADPQPKARRGK